MAVHMQATIELFPGKIGQFKKTLLKTIPIMESAGMKLVGSWVSTSGVLNTVTDLWLLEDLNTQSRAFAALMAHESFAEIRRSFDECIQKETIVFMDTFLKR